MDLKKIKKEIIEIGKRLYDKNLTYGTSGNISVKVNNTVLITASGTSLADLVPDDIVLIDLDGKSIDANKKASSEKMLHLDIYNKREDISAIVHCHPPAVSTFAVANIDLDKPNMAENILYFGKIPVAKYAMPSSEELVKNTAKYFEQYDVVLMANHGIIAGDKNIRHAFYKVETAEVYAKVCLYSKILGKEVPLGKKEVMELEALRRSIMS